jgi:hypothetical protein
MKTPPTIIRKGRGFFLPSKTPQGRLIRIARGEVGFDEFLPLLASAPALATLLRGLVLSQITGDSLTRAKLTHEAETLLTSLGIDWGTASHIINPVPPSHFED